MPPLARATDNGALQSVWSEYEIEATASLTDRRLTTLKHGDAFAVLDGFGDCGTAAGTAEGLYFRDTRFLSRFELRIEGKRPLLLSTSSHEDKSALTVELTNPDFRIASGVKIPKDTIFLQRTAFVLEGTYYQRLHVRSYARQRLTLRIDLLFDADFCDMFEVRGTSRRRKGTKRATVEGSDTARFTYLGLDEIERRAIVRVLPAPAALDENRAMVQLDMAPQGQASAFISVQCVDTAATHRPPRAFFSAYRQTRRSRRIATATIATVTSNNNSFEEILCRATSDIYTLLTWGEHGPYPYAGIPWFNTVFGRDGIITAMMTLWMDPTIAKGVLRTLAATQAQRTDSKADSQPGKILHEMRHGEMARLHEVPFGRYYGTVDATPLFVMLAGMYLERTGELSTIRELWPNICGALNWIDEFGDADRDGFVEYARADAHGLINQGWKDSFDSIFHADGTDAVGPIALCEVQGYVFAAKLQAALMARCLGLSETAKEFAMQAERLRKAFEDAFWCEDLQTYALALDGLKRPCRVVASNAGHALFCKIARPERAALVASRLLAPDAFSGWGIRTLAAGQPRYNPMSYHNGSVWPHDNAITALGFARYGLKTEATRVFGAMCEAANHQDLRRLPELFCGFARHVRRAPTPYPVACAPQAWAAAAVFGLLQAASGVELKHQDNEVRFLNPDLPGFLEEVGIHNLGLGTSLVDVRLRRHGGDVAVNILKRDGSSKVVVLK